MLDPEHMNHVHEYRQTMWQIHPVTRIEVFVKGTGWVKRQGTTLAAKVRERLDQPVARDPAPQCR